MKICNFAHTEIVYKSEGCPLCKLIKHNNQVHDFIESQGDDLIKKLIDYQFEHNNKGRME